MELLSLPTELANGLRLEDVFFNYEIRPKIGFSAPNPALTYRNSFICQMGLGYPLLK
jgi:hypothetical protein